MERMKELIEILNNASKSYYQLDNPIMSDHDYDKLYDELLSLEENTGIIIANSPTKTVGYTVLSNLVKVKHDSKMLSLDKTKKVEKLKEWLGDNQGLLSWKLDGLTIVLKYNNGELIQAVTRGNGEIGEDITHNAKVFKNIPLRIKFKNELVLRGEGVIAYSEFEKINSELGELDLYKNPRNLCSGTVRQLNSEIVAKRNVMFYAFTLVTAEGNDFGDLKSNQIKWLNELGFDVVEYKFVNSDTLNSAVIEFENNITKNDFASDGLVLTYNNISYSSALGNTSKFPRDSIAFKWADEMAETTLTEIFWSTSRTGLINPVAVFEPVDIEGSTVSRASVHNVSILEELQLGIGDKIKVYKANMIIPQIAENITKSGAEQIPNECPICGGETEIREVKDAKALYCTNPNCKAQLVMSLSHFTSRDAMNIEGLSEETLKKFVELEIINNYTDIYNLKSVEKIKELDGFGEKSFFNLVKSIEKSKNVQLSNFIYALGINNVGLSNAKLLCKYFQYDIEKIRSATEEDLIEIDGFGGIIAHSIYKYFNDEKSNLLLDISLKNLNIEKPEIVIREEGQINFDGLTFVITGDVNYFKNRKELQNKIELLGGKVTGSVTKKTNYLINNDSLSETSKNLKAKELGVPIITEQEFLNDILKERFE